METQKPSGFCQLDGCFTYVKNKIRKYCSRECHEKAIGLNIPKCKNPECSNKVKRGRDLFCSRACYTLVKNKNAHNSCQRPGCLNLLTSRKSTRKYCSQTCYKLDKSTSSIINSKKVIQSDKQTPFIFV